MEMVTVLVQKQSVPLSVMRCVLRLTFLQTIDGRGCPSAAQGRMIERPGMTV